jgi:hypothetical protein
MSVVPKKPHFFHLLKMCLVKNLQQTTQDFDSWFSNLNQDFKVENTKVEDVIFEQLLAPLPPYEPVIPFQPAVFTETIETIEYPTSYPSPTSLYSQSGEDPQPLKRKEVDIDEQLIKKRQRQNEAAKRCREKKLSALQEAQENAKRFEQQSFELSVKLAVLEKEQQAWVVKEKEMQQQVEMLKQQLDESHLILMKMTAQ